MAGRPRLAIGELGSVSVEVTPTGVRARARIRDAGGALRRISASAPTEELARKNLELQAASAALLPTKNDDDATLAELLDEWVARTERVKRPQTARTYASIAGWLTKLCGALSIHELDVDRARELFEKVEKKRSPAAVRQARVALNGAIKEAIRRGIIKANPLRDMEEEEPEEDTPTYLEVAQVQVLRQAIREREERT